MGTAWQYLEAASRALEAERPSVAATLCMHVLRQYPKYVACLQILARAQFEIGDLAHAEDLALRVLNADPTCLEARRLQAIISERQGYVEDAVWHLQLAYDSHPSDPAIRSDLERVSGKKARLGALGLGNLYARQGTAGRAIEEISELSLAAPERLDALVPLMQLYSLVGRRLDSLEVAKKAYALSEDCLCANLVLAYTEPSGKLRHGPRSEAFVHCSRLRDLDPENYLIVSMVPLLGWPKLVQPVPVATMPDEDDLLATGARETPVPTPSTPAVPSESASIAAPPVTAAEVESPRLQAEGAAPTFEPPVLEHEEETVELEEPEEPEAVEEVYARLRSAWADFSAAQGQTAVEEPISVAEPETVMPSEPSSIEAWEQEAVVAESEVLPVEAPAETPVEVPVVEALPVEQADAWVTGPGGEVPVAEVATEDAEHVVHEWVEPEPRPEIHTVAKPVLERDARRLLSDAEMHVEMRLFDLAAEEYRQALDEFPEVASEVAAHLEQTLAIHGEHPKLRRALASAYGKQGKFRRAVEEYSAFVATMRGEKKVD